MANGQVPYKKETGVATFPDVDAWKAFGINKSFGEVSTPVNLPTSSKASVAYPLSDHQLGKSTGKLGTSSKADVVDDI